MDTVDSGVLVTMGETGVSSLVESIKRQKSAADNTRYLSIKVEVPHSNSRSFIVKAKIGQSLKECIDQNRELASYLECACGGIAACSTCHIYIAPDYADTLEPPEEAELDMLDLASDTSDYSRLACQVMITDRCKGLTIIIPRSANNLFSR
jgi:2Fe-2S ferredoxin